MPQSLNSLCLEKEPIYRSWEVDNPSSSTLYGNICPGVGSSLMRFLWGEKKEKDKVGRACFPFAGNKDKFQKLK